MLDKLPIVLFFFSCSAMSAQNVVERYSTIGLRATQYDLLAQDASHGLAIDHFHKNDAGLLEFTFSTTELEALSDRGVDYSMIIADHQAHFDHLVSESLMPRSSACGLEHFDTGEMGGYHTYDEMVAHITEMSTLYADYVHVEEIGRSIEDRPIYAVKISDNPELDESDVEGVVYYEAITHAREPMSLEATLYYMWWLLETSDVDDEVAYLIDNREIYFVPIVNPDGYVYNQEIQPNGGGLWRKNRRNVDGTCFGVDLNRNYTEGYGLNSGSSSDPCSQTYRGTEALSEPESQALANFVDRIQPAVAFSSHTHGDKFLSPWGYTNGMPDFDLYAEFASEFIPEEYDGYGTTATMLGYTSSGTTRDHMHTHGTLTWTPEIGHAFWESPAVICDRVIEFRKSMLYLTWLSGAYTCYHDHQVISESIVIGDTVTLDIRLKNRGLSHSAQGVTIVLQSDHPAVQILDPVVVLADIESRSYGRLNDPAQLYILDAVTPGERIPIDVVVRQGGQESYRRKVYLTAGQEQILYSSDFELDDDWPAGAMPWDTCSIDAVSGDYSFADSPIGPYDANASSLVTMTSSIDLSDAALPIATFNAKWSLEVDRDYVTLLGSTDGLSWQVLQGVYNDALGRYTANRHWVQEQVDLSTFVGQPTFYLGFRLDADFAVHSDGFYIDDLKIADYQGGPISSSTDLVSSTSVRIYPNPVVDLLSISAATDIDRVTIIGIDGSVVYQANQTGSNFAEVNVSKLPSGLYLVDVREVLGRSTMEKVVIK